MRNTEMSVSQIAEKLHFSNRAHFYKVFDRYYHMPPKQYREKSAKKTP
ncbi:MAG: helix-turn-helix domain-containing protein [Bariatricus sp.]|nr:helix-turn-helix domain-containing protein [Bariatricus sp.]